MGGAATLETEKNTDYIVGLPIKPWEQMSLAESKMDADFAFNNPNTGSSFYLRSECHSFKDASLERLTGGLIRLFKNTDVLDQAELMFAKRAAKKTTFIGELDGVKVKVSVLVLKKHSCYFDFVFVALPKHYSQDISVYDKFIKTFKL